MISAPRPAVPRHLTALSMRVADDRGAVIATVGLEQGVGLHIARAGTSSP
jgi:hypothetical protein